MSKNKTYYVSNPALYQHYLDWYAAMEQAKKDGKEIPDISSRICAPIVDAMQKICSGLSYNEDFINYSFKDDMIGDALIDCVRFADKFNPHKLIYKIKMNVLDGSFEKGMVIVGHQSGTLGKIKYINYKTGLTSYTPISGEYFIEGEHINNEAVTSHATVLKEATHKANNPFNFITTIAYNAFLRRIDTEKKQAYIKAKILSETPIHEFFEQLDGDDSEMQQNFIEFLAENSDNLANNEPMAIKRKKKKAAEKQIALDAETLEGLQAELGEDASLERFENE